MCVYVYMCWQEKPFEIRRQCNSDGFFRGFFKLAKVDSEEIEPKPERLDFFWKSHKHPIPN